MLKLVSIAVILTGCGYLGNLFAMNCKRRHIQLKELGQIISQLEFHIGFLGTPVPDALRKIASGYSDGIGDVLRYVCGMIKGERCVDMATVWRCGFDRFRESVFLKDEDIDIILEFSKKLGLGDREHEKTNLKSTSMRLKMAEDEAGEISRTNVKMYRGLGILAGIFIVIVLV